MSETTNEWPAKPAVEDPSHLPTRNLWATYYEECRELVDRLRAIDPNAVILDVVGEMERLHPENASAIRGMDIARAERASEMSDESLLTNAAFLINELSQRKAGKGGAK
jgi:hypothetical protein